MNKTLAMATIAAFCGSAAVTGLALSARSTSQPELAPGHPLASVFQQDQQAMMDAWMASAQTGPAHEWLGQFVGTWKTKMSMSMEGQEMVSEGTATYEWLIPGRFLSQRYEGDMMGAPMSGFGITGFDNLKRQFVGCWVDSMGTGILSMQGSLDPSGKIQSMVGMMDEPMTGEHGKAVLWVTTLIDANHFKFEAREILYGEAWTVFTIEYSRAD